MAGDARGDRSAKGAQRLRTKFATTSSELGKVNIIGTLDAGKEADLIVVDLAALLPYPQNQQALVELAAEDVVALCIYRGGPQANLETYVRGKCIYQAPGLAVT